MYKKILWYLIPFVLLLSGCGEDAQNSSIDETTPTPVVINKAPVGIFSSFVIEEDTSYSGYLSALDYEDDNLTYSIVAAPQHGTINLDTNGSFTYTPSQDYFGLDNFSYQADDANLSSAVKTVEITIININDAPIVTTNANITVPENQLAAFRVTATDIETENLSYNIDGDDAASFTIDQDTGVVTFNVAPDYEVKNSYSVLALARDCSHVTSKEITISISNVVDTPPTLADTALSVNENATVDTLVGQLMITSIGDSPITSIALSGISSTYFKASNDGNISVASGAQLDYETVPSYSLQAVATNAAGSSLSVALDISVVNMNDNDPVFTSATNFFVQEQQTSALTLTATDIDALDPLNFSISGTDASAFNVDALSGVVTFKSAPDFDIKKLYTFIATVSDGLHEVSQTITINILEKFEFDLDSDYIPDDVELHLGMDPNNSDENANGILDGLETNSSIGDTFFRKQWHLDSLGTLTNNSGVTTLVGQDLDILELYHSYMGYNSGNNIIVQVVDTGVDAAHEDLSDNMDLSRSFNGAVIGDPAADPLQSNYTHGTKIAGIIASRAFNGVGVRGVLPFAKIAASNWVQDGTLAALDEVWLSGSGANEIAVSNNSWGNYSDNDVAYETIMASGVQTLRNGRGRIYVFAVGDYRGQNGNANLSYMLNNRYALPVAALKYDSTHTASSTPGANVFISGYSGESHQNTPTLGTTTVTGTSINTGTVSAKTTWDEDTQRNYSFDTSGTNAAAPTVSASLAMVLEACPGLTWRDVRYLTAKHATQIDTTNTSWKQNAAGISFSNDYGFGLINPKAMIRACTATGYQNLASEQTQSLTQTFNAIIPDDQDVDVLFNMQIPNSLNVEWLEVTIDNNSSFASDYRVEITSPSGTKIRLMDENTNPDHAQSLLSHNWMNGGFRLSTAAFLDEDAQGEWIISMSDKLSGNLGTTSTIKIELFGH